MTTTDKAGPYGLCNSWAVKRSLSREEMQASASTLEEDFNDAVQCTQYQLGDEMEEEDLQDTQTGPQLILVGTSGQPEMSNFSLPAPQIASLYVTAGRSSLPEIKKGATWCCLLSSRRLIRRIPTPSFSKRWCCSKVRYRLVDRRQALDNYI